MCSAKQFNAGTEHFQKAGGETLPENKAISAALKDKPELKAHMKKVIHCTLVYIIPRDFFEVAFFCI